MAVVTCQFFALDDTVAHDPIVGVGVRIFDEAGTVFVTSGVTNALGLFQCDLPGSDPATRYQVRCYKLGTSFENPVYADVYDPLPPATANKFLLYGNIFEVANASNPRMCRASGIVVDPGGRPLRDAMIRFMNLHDPVMVDAVVVAGSVEVRSDSSGRVAVELFREGKYVAAMSGLQDERLNIIVPDRGGVNIKDLLFPVVESVAFNPLPPWNVAVGATLEITPTVTASSYAILEGAAYGDVRYATADPSIALVSVAGDVLKIYGLRVGSTTLTVERRDDSVRRIPDSAITGSGSVINVT